MAFKKIVIKTREGQAKSSPITRLRFYFEERPRALLGSVLGVGCIIGLAGGIGASALNDSRLQAKVERQDAELAKVKRDAQTQVNALAARLGELQAQATRLNALGERLTQMGKLEDGEFDFNETPGLGDGDAGGPTSDIPVKDVNADLQVLEQRFAASGRQLSVMESLMFDHQLQQNAVPSRMPIRNSYVTSGFGTRADPFGRGAATHKGMDFHAKVGDPVMAVAEGVVSFAGVKGGYGNVVDVDHGNGYVTRYAHNSRLVVKAGDLVRAGQEVAKAGSTGRSTGAHVHFEVWENGNVVNPRKFLGDGGNTPVGRVSRG
ncbi:M23 family metallopeptidase [Stenotrophomonas sp. GD03777]|uniref:M23 family metallopeptidase n=1 Tax=Stenotrophomonas TaxID=40323 RepID=UPI002448091C|nr:MULTISPECIES: M23 family metallopeptidase [Stenotrophomonas]MDH1662360.1 M23 family metallopeptidase [Stenotrophomonas sp. GD03777]